MSRELEDPTYAMQSAKDDTKESENELAGPIVTTTDKSVEGWDLRSAWPDSRCCNDTEYIREYERNKKEDGEERDEKDKEQGQGQKE